MKYMDEPEPAYWLNDNLNSDDMNAYTVEPVYADEERYEGAVEEILTFFSLN